MSYNFYFISGRNPASTIQALQQTPKAQPEPRPRPVLQLVDQLSPEIAPLTEANVQGTTPAPRPRNRDILRQRAESIRAESIRDDASIRAPSTRRSRSHRSRSPGRQSTQVTGQIAFHPSPPNIEAPPGQWNQNTQGVWNQYGESTQPLPPAVTDPQLWRPPAVAVPQPRPPGFPYCTFAPRQNPLAGQSPPVVPVASRPFSVFPPFSGTQTVPRPIASPPSGDPVIPVENLIDTSVSLNVTPNQTEFRAWINGRVHPSFGMKDTMVQYISRMLDAAKYNVADLQDLKLLKYDPKDHEQDPGDRQPLYYYLLRIPGFRRRAKIADHLPPAPQRANQALNLEAIEHVMISHTSNPGGASGILKEAKIAPSRLHVSNSNSFFSLGARKTGHLEWDMKEFARIIHNTWFLSKQQCSLVFVGTAWGTAVAVKEGGEQACCDLTRNGGTVHHQRAKMWVTNTNSHILTAIAFPVTALPPTWFAVMCFCVFGLVLLSSVLPWRLSKFSKLIQVVH